MCVCLCVCLCVCVRERAGKAKKGEKERERVRERGGMVTESVSNIDSQILCLIVSCSPVQKTLTSEGGDSGRYPPEGLKEPAPDGTHALSIHVHAD